MFECPLFGHPDKMADIIADAILDFCLIRNDQARVACEVMVAKGAVVIGGEIDAIDQKGIEDVIRKKITDLGYIRDQDGIDGSKCKIKFSTSSQSPFLKSAIGQDLNSGDQSIVVGYATNETNSMLPYNVYLGKDIARQISVSSIIGRKPDGKIFILDSKDKYGRYIKDITVNVQQNGDFKNADFRTEILNFTTQIMRDKGFDCKVNVNPPTGDFRYGGPQADTGLTGRKLVADSYGPFIPHGGGALSGKDCTKIDRTGAYTARCIAKTLVSMGYAAEVTVFLGYMIGVKQPISIQVWERKNPRPDLAKIIENLDLSLGAMIEFFDLRRPIFCRSTEAFHYGIDLKLPWEIKTLELPD